MKKTTIKLLIILFLIVGYSKDLDAQFIVLGDSTNRNNLLLSECNQSDTFDIYVRVANGSLSDNMILKDSFMSQFIITGVIANQAIVSMSGINSSVLELILSSNSLNNTSNSGLKIQLLVKSKCNAKQLSSARHFMQLKGSNGLLENRISPDFVNAIKSPILMLESRNTANITNAVLGATYNRNWRIRNIGSGSSLDTVWFRINYQSGLKLKSLLVNGVSINPTFIKDDTVWYKIIQHLRDQTTFKQDTVFIQEKYEVLQCPSINTNSMVIAYWGCYNDVICNFKTINTSTFIPFVQPSLVMLGTQFFNDSNIDNRRGYRSSTCAGKPSSQIAWVRNSGSTSAFKIKAAIFNIPAWVMPSQYDLSSWITSQGTIGNSNNAIDTASLFYKIGVNGNWNKLTKSDWVASDSGVNRGISNCSSPIGWPNITFIHTNVVSDLPPGDTLFFKWKSHTKCCSNCTNYTPHTASIRFDYQNLCENSYSYLNAETITEQTMSNSLIILPPSILKTGEKGFLKGRFSMSNRYDLDGDDPLGTLSSHRLKFELTIPTGFIFDKDSNDLYTFNSNLKDSLKPTEVVFDKNVLTFYFNRRSFPFQHVTEYELWVKLRYDCNISGALTGLIDVPLNVYYEVDGCDCKMNIICTNLKVYAYCETDCNAGGASMLNYNITRKNIGLPDNNGDGVADGEKLDLNIIKSKTFAWLDTMVCTTKAIVETSQSQLNWQYIYFEQDMGRTTDINNSNNYSIKHLVSNLVFYDISNGMIYSGSLIPSSVNNSSLIRFNLNSILPVGFRYENGDTFKIISFWEFSPSQRNVNSINTTLNVNSNNLYASNVVNPSVTNRFSCNNIPGFYETQRVEGGVLAGFSLQNNCSWNYNIAINFSGGETSDPFRYEIREFSYIDSLYFRIPKFIKLDLSKNITYNLSKDKGNNGTGYSGVIPWSRLVTIVPDSIYKLSVGYLTKAGGGVLENSDDGYSNTYTIPFYPSCSSKLQPVECFHSVYFKNIKSAHNWGWHTNFTTNGPSINSVRTGERFDRSNHGVSNNIHVPNLELTSSNNEILLEHDTAVWNIRISNKSSSNSSINTFIILNNLSKNIIPLSVKNLTNNNIIIPKPSLVYQLGVLSTNSSNLYQIRALLSNTTLDSLVIVLGNECNGYPSNINDFKCHGERIKLKATKKNVLIQTDIITAPPVEIKICDTISWVLSIKQKDLGIANNVILDVVIPDGGLGANVLKNNNFYKYPYNTNSYKSIGFNYLGGGVYRFNLSDSILSLKLNGLRPISESPQNEILFKLSLLTNCNFISGTNIKFIVRYKNTIGADLLPDIKFGLLKTIGAPTGKLQIPELTTKGIKPCDNQMKLNYLIKNIESYSSLKTDSMSVILPEELRFVNNTANFIHNAFEQKIPNIQMLGKLQKLTWSIFPLKQFDSVKMEIEVELNKQVKCNENIGIESFITSNYENTCNFISCNSKILNSHEFAYVTLLKPSLNITDFYSEYYQSDKTYIYEFKGIVNNLNLKLNTKRGLVLKTYFDDNYNGLYDRSLDKLVKTTYLDSSISKSGFLNFKDTFYYPRIENSLLYSVIDTFYSDSNCFCEGLTVSSFNKSIENGNVSSIETGDFINNIKIQPNPANDFIEIINQSENSIGLVKVYDNKGKLLYNEFIDNPIIKIDTTIWSPGLYTIYIKHSSDFYIFKFNILK